MDSKSGNWLLSLVQLSDRVVGDELIVAPSGGWHRRLLRFTCICGVFGLLVVLDGFKSEALWDVSPFMGIILLLWAAWERYELRARLAGDVLALAIRPAPLAWFVPKSVSLRGVTSFKKARFLAAIKVERGDKAEYIFLPDALLQTGSGQSVQERVASFVEMEAHQ